MLLLAISSGQRLVGSRLWVTNMGSRYAVGLRITELGALHLLSAISSAVTGYRELISLATARQVMSLSATTLGPISRVCTHSGMANGG